MCNILRYANCPFVSSKWTAVDLSTWGHHLRVIREDDLADDIRFGELQSATREMDRAVAMDDALSDYHTDEWGKAFFMEMLDMLVKEGKRDTAIASWDLVRYFWRANIRLDKIPFTELLRQKVQIRSELLAGTTLEISRSPGEDLHNTLNMQAPYI